MSANRSYCLTSFNKKTKWDVVDKYRYLIVGKEKCPKTGKIHFQCYIELNEPQRPSYIKKIFNDNTIHIEARRGSRDQARDYCKKEKDFTEHGKWISGQGHRSDLESFVNKLKDNVKLNDLMLEEPTLYCKYKNGLKDINAELIKRRNKNFRKLEVILLTGPTCCGKTRFAIEEAKEDFYKIEGDNLQWFQDYNEEKILIIDEYNNDIVVTKLLNLLDGYQLRLNVKGSHTYAAWNKVFITTNLKWDEIHPQAKTEHRNALRRRITNIISYWPEEESNEVL